MVQAFRKARDLGLLLFDWRAVSCFLPAAQQPLTANRAESSGDEREGTYPPQN